MRACCRLRWMRCLFSPQEEVLLSNKKGEVGARLWCSRRAATKFVQAHRLTDVLVINYSALLYYLIRPYKGKEATH